MLTFCLVLGAGLLLGYASGNLAALSLASLSIVLAAGFGPAVLFGLSGPLLATALLCLLQTAFVAGGLIFSFGEATGGAAA